MPTARINEIDLYYEVQGEGPSLVFAHGIGGNHAGWYQQVLYFARWFKVVTFDHRGFGNSKDLPDGPGRSSFVDDLRALLDHLEIENTVLVAQSMGGSTYGGFTLTYPERVKALVLGDTLGGIKLPPHLESRMEEVRKDIKDFSQLDRVLSMGFRVREPELAELYRQISSFNTANRLNIRGEAPVGPSPEELVRLQVPVLFIVGLEDVLFPPDVIRELHRLVPGSTLVEVPDAGHSVYYEQPQIFNHTVHRFLESVGVVGETQSNLQPVLQR